MPKRTRRGQSEVIGGLIVLTLLFMFAIPVVMNTYYSMIKTGEEVKTSLHQEKTSFNEKLSVGPVNPNSELAQRAGWIPGVWINNTGTVSVTLDKLYLVDVYNDTIYKVYDLKYARPLNTPDISKMLIDVKATGVASPPPPTGQAITLQPGETLLIVFNTTFLNIAPNVIVLVESTNGILHPVAGATGTQTLYPGRPSTGGVQGLWRGIFAPQSGFSLRGYNELSKYGTYYAWRPPIFVQTVSASWWNWLNPTAIDYTHSFIYEDPEYPGLYMLDIGSYDSFFLYIETPNGYDYLYIDYDYTIYIHGFVGTYDTGRGTYISGYAYEILVYDDRGKLIYHYGPYDPVDLGSRGITESDFDGNGIQEITFYSYLNGPTYTSSQRINNDADGDGNYLTDSLVWTYMVARDISGVDYVKVTVKLNYYWTTTFTRTGCPDWNYRHLKVFSIVVWKYNDSTGSWEVAQYQNYGYTSEKPVQFQKTAIFPLEHNGTYRVGIMIYDNYRDWDGYGYQCWTDFTMSLEHMIVEYGVYNPLFQESPPLYIVAIPDPTKIGDIGELDYMNAFNITDVSTAKVLAQQNLLNKLTEELNYAGIAGYTIIRDASSLCNLLLSTNPPKYGIIVWLQGNVTPTDVVGGLCNANYNTIVDKLRANHWVLVWPFGKPFGDITATYTFNSRVVVDGPGNYTGNITDAGIYMRKKAYAFYLLNSVLFKYQVIVDTAYLIENATFYTTGTNTYGTVAFWVMDPSYTVKEGAVVLNPVHIDWDGTGDGALPETVVQQTVYSSLMAWIETVQNT
ncbi:MAG: hypothetical protein F7B19_04945 [Desulfurococcales archaeon]|nr:hypothetical protein [Desulfurococcales archaeon]